MYPPQPGMAPLQPGYLPPPVAAHRSGPARFVPYLFLAGAVIAAIGCLARPDYNLPVFLFAYIAWSYLKNQKWTVIIIFLWSIVIDVLWFFFIFLAVWMWDEYKKLADFETNLHWTVFIVVIINLVLKVDLSKSDRQHSALLHL